MQEVFTYPSGWPLRLVEFNLSMCLWSGVRLLTTILLDANAGSPHADAVLIS